DSPQQSLGEGLVDSLGSGSGSRSPKTFHLPKQVLVPSSHALSLGRCLLPNPADFAWRQKLPKTWPAWACILEPVRYKQRRRENPAGSGFPYDLKNQLRVTPRFIPAELTNTGSSALGADQSEED